MTRESNIHGLARTVTAAVMLMLLSFSASAQADRHDVRAGNRKFRKENFKEAEIDYRKAVVKDSTSMAAQYNLAGALYRQEDFEGAGKALDAVKPQAENIPAMPDTRIKQALKFQKTSSDLFYNEGDVALQKKDYAAAVEAFKQALLRNPGDLDAKENYIYAKLMLQNQQNGGGGGGQNDQNQDNNQDQNDQDQDNNQDQNQDNNQDNNQDQNQGDQGQDNQNQPQESKISPQQAQQMLQAIQAKEKETQDKVNKEKAALLKSRQKEKNW